MTPEIPKGWEKCESGKATYGLSATGKLFHIINKCIAPGNDTASKIYPSDFEHLGIVPLRLIEVEPIEFEVSPQGEPAYGFVCVEGTVYDKIPATWIGKTFREVIADEPREVIE